jgi:hypothetical protein
LGSKGSNTTTTTQNQTYTANPVVSGAGTQAINMATNAANTPFSLPTAPVAGFQPDQLQAFQQYRDIQGMAQPYYNQAQGYIQNSAAPITGQDIGQYYNPMASSVLANLHESQGQQMNDLTGRLTQTAGGVGASRVAVGQSELGRQHQLAEGQTLSGLYDRALAAAQQNKQMQANAGYGLTNLGTTAQGAALQGTGALGQSGNQQQAQAQNVLNAPYQNELARLAYPFQTAQYLAGITGGLSGAMGGTTSGTGSQTAPAPSLWSQLLGAGTAAAGAFGASGGFDSWGGGRNTNVADGSWYGPSSLGGAPLAADGGRIGYANGGATWMDAADPLVPDMQVRSQANPGAKLDLAPSKQSQEKSGPGLADVAKIAMMFINRGGRVSPYANGGEVGPNFDDRFTGEPPPGMMADGADAAFNTPLQAPPDFNSRFQGERGTPFPQPPSFDERFAGDGSGGAPMDFTALQQPLPEEEPVINPGEPHRLLGSTWGPQGPPEMGDGAGGTLAMANPDATLPPNATTTQGTGSPMANPAVQNTSINDYYKGLDRNLPYPDLNPKNDVSRNFAKSPWMALISAGAGMMAGTSPFAGVNIGKGLQAGTETLQQQRKDLVTEEGVNQRARQLMMQAQNHIDQYTKMTPYQSAQIENQKLVNQRMIAAMNMKGWKLANENTVTGDKMWVQDGSNNVRIIKGDGTVVTGSLDDPNSFRQTKINKQGDPTSITELPKSEQPPPPMGQPELASSLVPDEIPAADKSIYRKGSPALSMATAAAKKTAQDFSKEAQTAPQTEALLQQMKVAYGTLNKDNKADSFLTKLATLPGEGVDQRIDYAIKANGLAAAAGKPPIIDPEKLAAMEQIRKSQSKLGMLFASQISAREAWAGQEAAIRSTPGLTQSPLGMLKMISSYEMVDQVARDKRQYFNNYIQKNGVPGNWEAEYHKKNPQDRYIVRSMVENLPNRRAAEKLPEAIKILRANPKDPKVIEGFNRLYANTASFWLTGKLDMLGGQ